MTAALTTDLAASFARIALGHVQQEYPNKLDHVMGGDGDARTPSQLHPIFYGSFDWHSCVHGYWMLARVLRRFPEGGEAGRIRTLFDEMLTPEKAAGELAYLQRPLSRGFERPYGWAWALMLQAELERLDGPWAEALRPLAAAFAERFKAFLPVQTYPIRTGTHFNTAFALRLAAVYAEQASDTGLEALIAARARDYYSADRDCQAWEPGGDEFLSSALMEAELMRCILPPAEFAAWFAAFLPRLDQRGPATLFTPATVSDRSDGKIAHLDGLNLSRAWCWRNLEPFAGAVAKDAARDHLDAALPHVAGDYMGEHWLATFAVLALDEVEEG
ncbi:MAG: DUF2891 domain-containing protein [Caulobacteraceae bacterium]